MRAFQDRDMNCLKPSCLQLLCCTVKGYSQHQCYPRGQSRLWRAATKQVYTNEDSAIINVTYSLIQKEKFAWGTADARQQNILSLRR